MDSAKVKDKRWERGEVIVAEIKVPKVTELLLGFSRVQPPLGEGTLVANGDLVVGHFEHLQS